MYFHDIFMISMYISFTMSVQILQNLGESVHYEGESIKKQPNLFLGEIALFCFDVITL